MSKCTSRSADRQYQSADERVQFTVVMGVESGSVETARFRRFGASVALSAGELFGGSTLQFSAGYWSESAVDRRDLYPGLVPQDNAILSVSILKEDELSAMVALRAAVATAAREIGVPVKNIHVERSVVEARHFRVSEVSGPSKAAAE